MMSDATPTGPESTDGRRLHPQVFLARRRAQLEQVLQHPLVMPRGTGVAPERRQFLLEEAQELYWN